MNAANPAHDPRYSGDLERLIKLMLLTTSPNEPEALAALRAANAWMRRNGMDWESLLRAKVTIVADPFAGLADPFAGLAAPAQATYTPPAAPARQSQPRPPPAAAAPYQAYRSPPPRRPQPAPKARKTTLSDLGLD